MGPNLRSGRFVRRLDSGEIPRALRDLRPSNALAILQPGSAGDGRVLPDHGDVQISQ